MHPIDLAEKGLLPDWLIRAGIRRLLRARLRSQDAGDPELAARRQAALLAELRQGPLAVETRAANEQHYAVPAEFYQHVLGPRLKYSCCYFPTGSESLAEAEEAMLRLTCERAQLASGMQILELGCGWGSLTLWMAQHYPQSQIVAVSNSQTQRAFIESRCRALGLDNVTVITANLRDFDTSQRFDRVVSVEMFEHMRNYELLLKQIASWLRASGKLFVHIFSHRSLSYLFETQGADNWMGRHFFTGGIMPSDHLLLYFQQEVTLEAHWRVNGTHYWRTCEAWLQRQDAQRAEILDILGTHAGPAPAALQFQRWRIFFMACAELFRYRQGREWFVSHYLFERRPVCRSAGLPSSFRQAAADPSERQSAAASPPSACRSTG